MFFPTRSARHILVRCPVCTTVLGEKLPSTKKDFHCSDCKTRHYYWKDKLPYKSIPDSHTPQKCKCAQCKDRH